VPVPAEWQQVEPLLELALKVEFSRRAELLLRACQGDEELYHELQSLLSYEEQLGEFLQIPALEMLTTSGASEGQPAPVRLPAGLAIGPYRVVKLVGHGGMGEVYQALDMRLHRDVALKFVPANRSTDAETLERFRREARAISVLNHPNICTLYDIGVYEGRPFLVLELLDGLSLKERLAGGHLPHWEVVALGIQTCRALEAAHAKGVVHRDLKPANIFVTSDGHTKVLDFGVAKLLSDGHGESAAAAAAVEDSITVSGEVIGTASYMSPEQAEGKEADPRSDLFSLGATMYQMATGVRPFAADTPSLTLAAVLTQAPVPPRYRNAAVPARLERVILKALEKARGERYQNAAEMRAELESLEPHASRRQGPLLAIAAALLLTAGLTLVGLRLGWFQAAAIPTHGKTRQVTSNTPEDPVPRASISPDGAYVAYVDLGGLHIRHIDSGETRTIPPLSPDYCFR
jgi:eukaryotic-like serine/threonine-protein kinase